MHKGVDSHCSAGRPPEVKVRTFMVRPRENEIIEADALLGKTVHQLVLGDHQSLLVTSEQRIIGALSVVVDAFIACRMEPK